MGQPTPLRFGGGGMQPSARQSPGQLLCVVCGNDCFRARQSPCCVCQSPCCVCQSPCCVCQSPCCVCQSPCCVCQSPCCVCQSPCCVCQSPCCGCGTTAQISTRMGTEPQHCNTCWCPFFCTRGGGGAQRQRGRLRTACGQRRVDSKQSNDRPRHSPQYANYWAPLTRKRHIPPHSAQPRHTNDWAPRTRKRHQQEHRSQRPTERSDPTHHAKGRTGDCPGPCKGTTTKRNVTGGGGGG